MNSLAAAFSSPALDVVPLADLMYVDRAWSRGHAHHAFDDGPPHGRIDFSVLQLFAFETVDASRGFAMHSHDNVEVLTLLLQGRGIHRDNLGAEVELDTDTVAIMSAGRGLQHAEHATEDGPLRLMQIWIAPRQRDTEPYTAQASCPRAHRLNRFRALASGRSELGAPLAVGQDAALLAAVLEPGARVRYALASGRRGYLVSTDAAICVNGVHAQAGERVLASSAGSLEVSCNSATEVVLLDLP